MIRFIRIMDFWHNSSDQKGWMSLLQHLLWKWHVSYCAPRSVYLCLQTLLHYKFLSKSFICFMKIISIIFMNSKNDIHLPFGHIRAPHFLPLHSSAPSTPPTPSPHCHFVFVSLWEVPTMCFDPIHPPSPNSFQVHPLPFPTNFTPCSLSHQGQYIPPTVCMVFHWSVVD